MKNTDMNSVNKTLAEIERLPQAKFSGLFKKADTTLIQQVVSQVLRQYRMHGNQIFNTDIKTEMTQVYQINSLNDVKAIMKRIAQLSNAQIERPTAKNR